MRLDKIAIIVDDYDQAIWYFTDVLGFDLVEDSPSLTNDGRPKRWVVVRPPDGGTGILLAQADGERQAAGIEFVTAPRTEPYGRVAVFTDIAGNHWDLLSPAPLAELIPAKHYIT